ncbi:ankyrin repeat domain-containing protein [Treponema sp.]|uniref:ankyrin repeat domain-containing protein n=1 Tax=Treponema sp. TaxID=166 RepID=UPI0025802D56|nr:ankyrin repeat domain-containing protein [Treponema sp.]
MQNTKTNLPVLNVSENGLEINGKPLEPFFLLEDLIAVVGQPDERYWQDPEHKFFEICQWNELGLRTRSDYEDNTRVLSFYLCLKKNPKKSLNAFPGDLIVNGVNFAERREEFFFNYIELGRDCIWGKSLDAEYGYCKCDDAEFIAFDFYKTIYIAVFFNRIDYLKTLVKAGHDVNCHADFNKEPLLSFAVSKNNPEIMQILIDGGADVNKQDLSGVTPLMTAIKLNLVDMARLLIKAGASSDIKDGRGFTARDYAEKLDVDAGIKELFA